MAQGLDLGCAGCYPLAVAPGSGDVQLPRGHGGHAVSHVTTGHPAATSSAPHRRAMTERKAEMQAVLAEL